MLYLEHSAILLSCIKRKLVLKTNFWSFLEWPFYTGFTVLSHKLVHSCFVNCCVSSVGPFKASLQQTVWTEIGSSNCSPISSLIWVQTVCLYAELVIDAVDDFQMYVFCSVQAKGIVV